MPFFNTSPPQRGGSHVLFQHFSSPKGRQSHPFLTLLLPKGEAVMLFFNTSPPRRGVPEAKLACFVVGSNQENDATSYFMVGSVPQKL